MNKKKVLIGLLVILAVLAGLLVLNKTGKLKLSNLINKEKANRQKANILPAPKYTKTDLPADKLPEAFPKDIIQEKDAVIITNNIAEKEDGTKTFTVQYYSRNTQQQIFKAYFDYLTKNNWALSLDSKVSENLSYLSAVSSKEKKTVYVNASLNESAKMITVSITLVQNK